MKNVIINLKAPNGNILNLFNQDGFAGDNMVNTIVSSAGTTAFADGTPPFTGVFKPKAAIGFGTTIPANITLGTSAQNFISNVGSFADLYNVTNGVWTLVLRDTESGNVGSLTSWGIRFWYNIV